MKGGGLMEREGLNKEITVHNKSLINVYNILLSLSSPGVISQSKKLLNTENKISNV